MNRFYEAVSVLLWATGLDYTVDANNWLVSGSASRERPYSGYLTFVRISARTGAARAQKSCSNCGPALKVSMAGNCDYCHVKVMSGAFDWVLSKVERDELYRG